MAENKENTNVNNGNQGVNNNTNVNNPPANNQQPNEYAGVKELFGDYTINKDTFTQEELQNILEGSERLKREMTHACSFEGKNIPVIIADYSITELSQAIGSKAAVVTVTDENFATALMTKYQGGKE